MVTWVPGREKLDIPLSSTVVEQSERRDDLKYTLPASWEHGKTFKKKIDVHLNLVHWIFQSILDSWQMDLLKHSCIL